MWYFYLIFLLMYEGKYFILLLKWKFKENTLVTLSPYSYLCSKSQYKTTAT